MEARGDVSAAQGLVLARRWWRAGISATRQSSLSEWRQSEWKFHYRDTN